MSLDTDFSEVLKAMNNLQKRVSTQATKEALLDGAEVTLKQQKIDVPKGDTGKLKKSLDIGKFRTAKGAIQLHIGIVNDTEREVVYGYYQHYGTRKMVGKYWINTAWKKSKEEAKEKIKIKLIKIIKGK